MVLNIRAVFAAALVQVIICSTFTAGADIRPTPRSLGREFIASSTMVIADPQAYKGDLNLHQALLMALQHNPELASSSWEVKAREAEAIQAGLRPNPDLDVEVEGFAGNGEFSDFDAAETTLMFSQLVELGRKREKRQASAILRKDLSGWDYEAKRLDVITETSKAFYTVLAAQDRLAQAEELGRLARQSHQVVSQRVASGKVSPLDQARAIVFEIRSHLSGMRQSCRMGGEVVDPKRDPSASRYDMVSATDIGKPAGRIARAFCRSDIDARLCGGVCNEVRCLPRFEIGSVGQGNRAILP